MVAEALLPLPRRLWIYQAERFPLQRHGPLITVFSGAAALYGARLVGGLPSLPVLLSAILCSGAFFLLMRIADEFKDRHDDQRCRPYRPVPRGLVSLLELAMVALATALLQGALVWRFAPEAWWLLLLTWGWFALMTVEFLMPVWLRARPLLYTFSHMVIVPLIALLALAMAVLPGGGSLPGPSLLPLLALCYLNGLAIEFARKIRFPDHEEPGVDTWSGLWGLGPAQGRWLVVVLLALPLALAAAQPIRAVPLVLLLLAPLLAWIVLRFRPVRGAGRGAGGGTGAIGTAWTTGAAGAMGAGGTAEAAAMGRVVARPAGRASAALGTVGAPGGIVQQPGGMAEGAFLIPNGRTGAAAEVIKAAARARAPRAEPLELPTALWTLATYLALGWLPALLGGLG